MNKLNLGIGINIGFANRRRHVNDSAILQENGDRLLLDDGTAIVLDTTISSLSHADLIDGNEYIAIVQGGETKKVLLNDVSNYLLVN